MVNFLRKIYDTHNIYEFSLPTEFFSYIIVRYRIPNHLFSYYWTNSFFFYFYISILIWYFFWAIDLILKHLSVFVSNLKITSPKICGYGINYFHVCFDTTIYLCLLSCKKLFYVWRFLGTEELFITSIILPNLFPCEKIYRWQLSKRMQKRMVIYILIFNNL
jgi:hypothetical protein